MPQIPYEKWLMAFFSVWPMNKQILMGITLALLCTFGHTSRIFSTNSDTVLLGFFYAIKVLMWCSSVSQTLKPPKKFWYVDTKIHLKAFGFVLTICGKTNIWVCKCPFFQFILTYWLQCQENIWYGRGLTKKMFFFL